MADGPTTLRLLFPQWQGGANPDYGFGARLLDWLAPAADGPRETVSVAAPGPEGLPMRDGIVGRDAILAQAHDARARIDWHRPDRLVVLGGDCSVDLAPFAYLNERYDGDLAVLWLDAHSDVLTKEIYPCAHAHVLGTLLGEGDAEFRALVPRPVGEGRALIAGLIELPAAAGPLHTVEQDVFRRRGVTRIAPDALAATSEPVLAWLRATGVRHVAIHFDLDVLDPALFRSLLFARPGPPAPELAGIPTGRMTLAGVVRLLADVAQEAEVVGLGITEHLPWDVLGLREALSRLPLIGSPRPDAAPRPSPSNP